MELDLKVDNLLDDFLLEKIMYELNILCIEIHLFNFIFLNILHHLYFGFTVKENRKRKWYYSLINLPIFVCSLF